MEGVTPQEEEKKHEIVTYRNVGTCRKIVFVGINQLIRMVR